MADPDHINLVRHGAAATWAWRGERLDLRDAELSGIVLRGARLERCDLRGARLVGADLTGSCCQEADLTGAQLIRATLDDARLGGSRLGGALLCSASLRRALLVRADLSGANLSQADLESANLSHARLDGAILDRTKLVDADLDAVGGLAEVIHQGPSELGTHALLRFGHAMPADFLRGVGLPESFIRYLPAIIASARPVGFFALYVCAAPADAELARRLHHDLQAAGVRCWLRAAKADAAELDEMVHVHDRSIVLCSAESHQDRAVADQLTAARRADRAGSIILLRLDDCPPGVPAGGSALRVLDFRGWQDFRSYQRAFDELVEWLGKGS